MCKLHSSKPFSFKGWAIFAAVLALFIVLTGLVATANASDAPKLIAVSPDGQAAMTVTAEQGACPLGAFIAEVNTVPASDVKLNGCAAIVTGHVLFVSDDGTLIILHPEDFRPHSNI